MHNLCILKQPDLLCEVLRAFVGQRAVNLAYHPGMGRDSFPCLEVENEIVLVQPLSRGTVSALVSLDLLLGALENADGEEVVLALDEDRVFYANNTRLSLPEPASEPAPVSTPAPVPEPRGEGACALDLLISTSAAIHGGRPVYRFRGGALEVLLDTKAYRVRPEAVTSAELFEILGRYHV